MLCGPEGKGITERSKMLFPLGFTLATLYLVSSTAIPNVEPQFLKMLRDNGRDEEFARYLGIQDVNLVRAQEGRTEEDLMFTTVSPLGDILLTPEQEEQARQGINFDRYPGNRWPDCIYYTIQEEDYTPNQLETIKSAIKTLDNSLTNLKLCEYSGQKDYVLVFSGNGCYSNLGKVGGQQPLSLQANGCLRTGTIQHEFIHAAGIMHEHCRSDRDDYVEVLFNNIPREWHPQYQKTNSRDFGLYGEYDPYSVMHYGMTAPGTGKRAFRFYSNVDERWVGQRQGPTRSDIAKVDNLYS